MAVLIYQIDGSGSVTEVAQAPLPGVVLSSALTSTEPNGSHLRMASAPPYPHAVQPEIRKLASCVVDQQITHLTEYLTTATKLIVDPTADTPARADRDHVLNHAQPKDMELLWGLTCNACTSDINAAHEHLRGVAALIATDDLLPLPALAVARSVYEAVLNACWLIDAALSMELRLARWAGRVLFDSQEGPNTLNEFGPSTAAERERTRVIPGREKGKEFLTRAGFELTPKKGDRSGETAMVTYLGASTPVSPKSSPVTAAVRTVRQQVRHHALIPPPPPQQQVDLPARHPQLGRRGVDGTQTHDTGPGQRGDHLRAPHREVPHLVRHGQQATFGHHRLVGHLTLIAAHTTTKQDRR